MSTSADNFDERALPHRIRCGQEERYAFFSPLRQQLILVDALSKSEIDLGFSPSRLLELLINKPNTIVTREEIMAYAWPDRIVTANSLNQAISSLREMLGDEKDRYIIQTIPRRGYLFSAEHLLSAEHIPPKIESAVNAEIKSEALSKIKTKNLAWASLLQRRKILTPVLIATLLFLISNLVYSIDWKLLFQPGLVVSKYQIKEHIVIYTAVNAIELKSLEGETEKLRNRLLVNARQPTTFIINRMRNYYEINCVDSSSVVEFIHVHRSRLNYIADQQLLDCLR